VDNQEAARVENMLTEKLGLADTYEAPIELYGELTGIHKEQAKWGITYAIIAMAIIIFIVFRRSVVVGTILLCIGLNMLGIVGGMALFQIPLGWPTLAAILMLLGYSIDTNILLVTRVVKRLGGEVRERIVDAMRTGLMMTFTTLAALFALNVFTTHPTLDYLSGALILGLIADLFNTWFLNGGVLIWHMKRREGKEYYVPT
jgi:preprotein translocase subunit SecF